MRNKTVTFYKDSVVMGYNLHCYFRDRVNMLTSDEEKAIILLEAITTLRPYMEALLPPWRQQLPTFDLIVYHLLPLLKMHIHTIIQAPVHNTLANDIVKDAIREAKTDGYFV